MASKQVTVTKSFAITEPELRVILKEHFPQFFEGASVSIEVNEHSQCKFVLTISKFDEEVVC